MKKINFINLLNESLEIYHGDNHNTNQLSSKLMMTKSSNNQEGVGIYFSDDINAAKDYGKNIISISINKKNFVESRDRVGSHISKSKLISLLKTMTKIDKEEMYYYMSDYTELASPENINESSYLEVAELISDEEIRNLQVDLARIIGVESFVKLWNKIIKIDGTYHRNGSDVWYAVINPKYNLN
jgi:hypothetical protein